MSEPSVAIRGITRDDFIYIAGVLDRWWGGPSSQRADPVFFYELGHDALVACEDGRIVGFLLGLVTRHPTPHAYVHLVGIDPDRRRQGLGKLLYTDFARRGRAAGAHTLKAIAAPGHEASLRFHEALGFHVARDDDYAGPGRARVVFTRPIDFD